MKKLFLSIVILVAGITSCSRNDVLDSAAVSGETAVTISATLPAEMDGTRAAGDGTKVNRCIMEIYLDGVLYGQPSVAAVSNKQATFSARLISGKTYDFVFWADAAKGTTVEDFEDNHYVTSSLKSVTVKDAEAYVGNDDTRDAFFGKETVEITASQSVTAKLYRPFGQLNIKTLDIQEVKDANIASLVPSHVSIAFESVPTGINLLTGELLETTDAVAYTDKCAVIDENGTLSMDYVFAPKGTEQYLANFTMSFFNAEGGEAAADYGFTNIPVQRNYRTNVSGNFLTKKADITVDVVPDFEDEDIDYPITDVVTVADANEALAAGKTIVLVSEAPTADAELILPQSTSPVTVLLPALTHKLTVKYSEGEVNPEKLDLTIPSVENLEIVTPNTTVTLNGAAYNTVSASTADNTLIVGEDVTIAELTLVKGSVEVYGNVVALVKKNSSSKVVLHVSDSDKLVAFKEGFAAADNNFFKSVNKIVLDGDINFANAEFMFEQLNNVSIDGQGYKISNFKAENVQCAGLICNAISVNVRNLTIDGADVKAVNDGGGNAYAGAIIGRSYGTIVFDNCTVMNSKVEGVNKVGGMIGFVAENHVEAADCKVVGSVISTEYVDGESGQIGGFAGYLGSQYNSTCSFANCSVEDCVINAHMGELGTKRAIGKFIGCMQASAATDILTVDNCSVNNVTLNRLNDNAKAYLSVHGDMLGGKRNAAGKVTITGCDTNIYVSTPEQLRYFAALVNGGDKNFANKVIALENDIDLSAAEWTPVNSWSGILNGLVLDGAGYTVSGMHINNTVTAGISLGFFNNNASKMTVKNITFDDARIIDKTNANQHYAGVIMGKNYSVVTFEQVHVTNSIVINNWQCGGLCGFAEGNAPVFNGCSISDSFVGGYNATSGTMFGLGQVDVVGSGCSATNVELYTDGLTWNSTQQQLGNFFVGSLYGKSLDAADYVETNVTVVAEYPEGYR